MKRVPHHRYLYERGGHYVFRRVVPVEHRAAFDGKPQVHVSLGTRDLAVARLAMADHLEDFEARLGRVVAAPRRGAVTPDREEMERGVRVWLAESLRAIKPPSFGSSWTRPKKEKLQDLAMQQTVTEIAIERAEPSLNLEWLAEGIAQQNGWTVERGSPTWFDLCDLVALAEIEHAKQGRDRLNANFGGAHNEPLFGSGAYAGDQQAGSPTMRQAMDAFLTSPELKANVDTRQHYRSQLETLVEALGPSRRIASITRSDCRTLRDEVILKLPRHRTKLFPRLGVLAAIKAGEAGCKTVIHPKTQNQMIDLLSGLFSWAQRYEHRADNPAAGLRLALVKEQTRKPFSVGELSTLLSAPIYQSHALPASSDDASWKYWLPLLGLFTGMRIGEICQLRGMDIEQVGEHWTIQIRADKRAGTSIKNPQSERRVPVHPELIALGFIEAFGETDATAWLFPSLRTRKDASDTASKWFGRFRVSMGLTEPETVFHSFRHTFRDALREAGVDEERSFRLGGWSKGAVGHRYGSGHSVAALAEAMARVQYPGLDLSHLRVSTWN